MSFNANTWSKDYTGARGLKLLAAADAARQGFAPKAHRAVPAALDKAAPQGDRGKKGAPKGAP